MSFNKTIHPYTSMCMHCRICGKSGHRYLDCEKGNIVGPVLELKKTNNVPIGRFVISDFITSNTKKLIPIKVNELKISGYFPVGIIDALDIIGKDNPENYIACVTYNNKHINKKETRQIYNDTQIGVTGSGDSAEYAIREVHEEMFLYGNSDNLMEIPVKNNSTDKYHWKAYICNANKTNMKTTIIDNIPNKIDMKMKIDRKKVITLVYGTINNILNIINNCSSNKLATKEDYNLYGIDIVRVDLLYGFVTAMNKAKLISRFLTAKTNYVYANN